MAPQGDPFDWWVTFMYFVGDCLWFVATSFQIIEALNTGWDTRYFEWQRDGCKGPPPRRAYCLPHLGPAITPIQACMHAGRHKADVSS